MSRGELYRGNSVSMSRLSEQTDFRFEKFDPQKRGLYEVVQTAHTLEVKRLQQNVAPSAIAEETTSTPSPG